MNAEEVAVKIAEHDNRIRVSEHRIDDLEEQQKQMQSLTLSVQELAFSVKNMVTEQKEQSERLRSLEDEPKKNWNSMKTSALTTITGSFVGAIVGALITLVASYF